MKLKAQSGSDLVASKMLFSVLAPHLAQIGHHPIINQNFLKLQQFQCTVRGWLGCSLISLNQLHLLLLALLPQHRDRVLGKGDPHSSRVAILCQPHHPILGWFKLREFIFINTNWFISTRTNLKIAEHARAHRRGAWRRIGSCFLFVLHCNTKALHNLWGQSDWSQTDWSIMADLVKLKYCKECQRSTWSPAPWNALFTSFGDLPAWIPLMCIVLVGIMIFFMLVFFKSSFQNLAVP